MRGLANIILFVVASVIFPLPGELVMHLFREPISEFVNHRLGRGIIVVTGCMILDILVLWLVCEVVIRIWFPYLIVKDEDLPDDFDKDDETKK